MTMEYYQNELKITVEKRMFKRKKQEDEQDSLLFKLNEEIVKSKVQTGTLLVEIAQLDGQMPANFSFKRNSSSSDKFLTETQYIFMIHEGELQIPGRDQETSFRIDGRSDIVLYVQIVGASL